MRGKFRTYGDKVFATYELLEMLLYHIIPYRDTNPTARRLMNRFATLDGLSLATRDEILEVEGIGEKTADFLVNVFKIYKRLEETDVLFAGERIIEKTSVGDFFVNYFKTFKTGSGGEEQRTVAAMLDSDMRLLAIVEPYAFDFGSGAVQSRPFIDAAVAAHATTVIIAHNHPYGPLFPSQADRASNALVCSDLANAGITLAEHYVVCADEYVCIMNKEVNLKLSSTGARSLSSIDRLCFMNGSYLLRTDEKISVLLDVLSLILKGEKAKKTTSALAERFARLCDVFYADSYVLREIIDSETDIIFLKIFFAIFVRRRTDRFVFGRTHTEEEIAEYFTLLLGLEPVEKVYLMVFDSKLRPKSCEFVAEGTVDTSSLPPRRMLEIAKRHGACGIAIAHNHPSSGVAPSGDDIGATVSAKSLFESVGIKFLSHYIVSSSDYCIIDENEVRYKKDV